MGRLKFKKHEIDDHALGTSYSDGDVIFQEDDQCDALYVVQTGYVRVVSIQPSGREIEIALAGPGEVFGITSLFSDSKRSASAFSFGQSSVLKLERARIMKAIHNDPSLVFFILKSISSRARKLKGDLVKSEARQYKKDPWSREDL
jgi:CRP-like cAMP-binding protein